MADYIPDGSTIFITIGTTVEQVARALLNHNHLRIITNSLRVAHILYNNPRFEVMVPGGTLRPHNSGIIGPSAAAFVAGFRADYLVTSVGAIESDGALLEFDVNEASVVKTMMAHSRHILLAADHTKYHASAAVEIGNVSQITALFTDEYPGGITEFTSIPANRSGSGESFAGRRCFSVTSALAPEGRVSALSGQ